MNAQKESRWTQRFANFGKAFARLKDAVELARRRPLSEVEEQGLIHCFNYTHELAWNTLKSYFEEDGAEKIHGSVAATRFAFREGLIENGETWMSMIKDSRRIFDAYKENVAREISSAVLENYFGEFEIFHEKFGRMQKGGAR